MNIEQLWSAALGALALTSTTLAGSRRRSAWVVGLVSQAGWIGFMVLTANYGFLVSIVGFTAVYIRNFVAWSPPARPDAGQPAPCGRACAAAARG